MRRCSLLRGSRLFWPPSKRLSALYRPFTATRKPFRRCGAQVKTTQETLALSIGSYKDGRSSLLDMLDEQRSAATSQANLAQAVQQTAKNYVTLNVAIGSGYNFDGAAIRPNSYEH